MLTVYLSHTFWTPTFSFLRHLRLVLLSTGAPSLSVESIPPAPQLLLFTMSEVNVYRFKAAMTCNSCSNCITKVLEKNQQKGAGITSFSVDLPKKEVVVTGTIAEVTLTDILDKTGIKVTLLDITPLASKK